jgi:hypothetical protein
LKKDSFPNLIKKPAHETYLTGAICLTFFLLGLPMMTGSGIYWIVLIDDYAGSWGLIFIAIIEGKSKSSNCAPYTNPK